MDRPPCVVAGAIVTMLALAVGGCHPPHPPGSPAPAGGAAASAQDIRGMTAQRFDHALFIKPNDAAASRREGALAPIIVQQTFSTDPAMALGDRFGAVVAAADGRTVIDPTRPAVYLARGKVAVQNSTLEQLTYVWFYAAPAANADPLWRAVRLTLADRDFPIIQEVFLSDDSRMARIYVFQSLESAAGMALGPALPGRAFVVEQPVSRQPRVVVPRILSDGHVAQGPLVYVDAGSHAITTLLCRCMPSQLENTVESPYYELLPLEDLAAARGVPHSLSDICKGHSLALTPRWLEEALRLPPLF